MLPECERAESDMGSSAGGEGAELLEVPGFSSEEFSEVASGGECSIGSPKGLELSLEDSDSFLWSESV